jgi:hypothetical protein
MPIASAPELPSCTAVLRHAFEARKLVMYSVAIPSAGRNHPFGEASFAHRDEAERFVERVRRTQPQLAASLRIETRELEAGRPN